MSVTHATAFQDCGSTTQNRKISLYKSAQLAWLLLSSIQNKVPTLTNATMEKKNCTTNDKKYQINWKQQPHTKNHINPLEWSYEY